MDGMADGSEDDAAATEIVCPAGNRFRAEVLKRQPVDILRFEKDVLLVLVVLHVMLLVVDDEIAYALRDGMARVHHPNFKRAQRRVAYIRSAHHLAIRSGGERNMAAVMQGIKAVTGIHEFF